MTARHHKMAPNSTAMAVVALLAAIICSSAALAADDVRVRFSWKQGRVRAPLPGTRPRLCAAKNLAVRSGQVRRYEACVSFAFTYIAVRRPQMRLGRQFSMNWLAGAFYCIVASDEPEVRLCKRLRARIRSKTHRSSTDPMKPPAIAIMALTLRISVRQLNCLRRCSMHYQ